MRKVGLAVVGIAALAAAGYSAAWFKKADEFKKAFEESVAALNEKTKPMMKDGQMVRYDSVQTSGFPFAMELTVNKPTLRVPVTSLLLLLPKEQYTGNIPEGYEWVEEVAIDGAAKATSNIIGSEFTFTITGNRHQKSLVNGQVKNEAIGSSSTPFSCKIGTAPTGFILMKPVFSNGQAIADSIRSLSCDTSGLNLKSPKGEELFTNDLFHFAVTHNVNGDRRSATLSLDSKGAKYAPGFDAYVSWYISTLHSFIDKPSHVPSYSFSEFGNSNMAFDVSYDGPATLEGFSGKKDFIEFNINKFDFSSALLNYGFQFKLRNVTQADGRKYALAIHSKGNVSERYDQILAKEIENNLRDLSSTEGKTGKDLEIANTLAKLGPPQVLVDSLMPKLHAMGDSSFDLDITGDGPADQNQFFNQGHIALNALNIITQLYGIKSSGDLRGTASGKPSGVFNLTCMNCDAMVDEIGNFAIRFATYLNTINTSEKKVNIPPREMFDGIKRFMRTIAINGNDTAARDLIVNVASKGTGDIDVSGKNFMEVVQSFVSNIAVYFPKPEPPVSPISPQMMQQR